MSERHSSNHQAKMHEEEFSKKVWHDESARLRSEMECLRAEMRRMDELHRQAMQKKDEMYLGLLNGKDEAHRADLKRKDEQLDNIMHRMLQEHKETMVSAMHCVQTAPLAPPKQPAAPSIIVKDSLCK